MQDPKDVDALTILGEGYGDDMDVFGPQATWICRQVEQGSPLTIDKYVASKLFPKLYSYSRDHNYDAWVEYVERPATDHSCTSLMTYAARHGIGMTNVGQALCKRPPPTKSQLKGALVTWLDSMRHLHYHGAVLPSAICLPAKNKAPGQRVEPPSVNVNFHMGGAICSAWKTAHKMLSGYENNTTRPLSSRAISSPDAFAATISAEYNAIESAARGCFTGRGPASRAFDVETVPPDAPPTASRNLASKVAEGCLLATEDGHRIRWNWEGGRFLLHIRGQEHAQNPFPGQRLLSHMLIHWSAIYNRCSCLGPNRTITAHSLITEKKRWAKAGPDPVQLRIAIGRAADAAWGTDGDQRSPELTEAMRKVWPQEVSAEAICNYTQLFGFMRNIVRVIAEQAHESSTWTLVAAIVCTIDQGKIELYNALAANHFNTNKLLGERVELPMKTRYQFIECMLKYERPALKLGSDLFGGWGDDRTLSEPPAFHNLPESLKVLRVSEEFQTTYNAKLRSSEKEQLRHCYPMSSGRISLTQCYSCHMPTKLQLTKAEVALLWNTYATVYPKAHLMMNLADTSTMPQAIRPECLRCRGRDGRQAYVQ